MPSPQWIGPFKVKVLLENCMNKSQEWPAKDNGVYVVSKEKWRGEPKITNKILYVGGNTGKSERFATRIGDLIADMFGFYGGGTGHHSGGRSINKDCKNENLNPLNLYLGWKKYLIDPESKSSRPANCPRCHERTLYDDLKPKLNKKKPSKCPWHKLSL